MSAQPAPSEARRRPPVEWCDHPAIPWLTVAIALGSVLFGVSPGGVLLLLWLSLERPTRAARFGLLAALGVCLAAATGYGIGARGEEAVAGWTFARTAHVKALGATVDEQGAVALTRVGREPHVAMIEVALAAGRGRVGLVPFFALVVAPDLLLLILIAAAYGVVGHCWRLPGAAARAAAILGFLTLTAALVLAWAWIKAGGPGR